MTQSLTLTMKSLLLIILLISSTLYGRSQNKQAEFSGGEKAYLSFLKENLVIIQFFVNKQGEVHDAEIIKSVHPELDEEALRIVNAMPQWKPGTVGGEAVDVHFTIPISFRLKDTSRDVQNMSRSAFDRPTKIRGHY